MLPGPVLGFAGECDAILLSWLSLIGLLELPNILLSKPPPCVERLLLLFPARMMDLMDLVSQGDDSYSLLRKGAQRTWLEGMVSKQVE